MTRTTPVRRRTVIGALALGVAASLTACSASDLIPGDLSVEDSSAEEVAVDFLESFNDGDMGDACDAVDLDGQFGGSPEECEQNLHALAGFWQVEDSSTWDVSGVEEETADGDTPARADVDITLEGGSGLSVRLDQLGGQWKVVDFG